MDKEHYFISLFKSKAIGDDAAFIDGVCYSKDAFFEGVHFKTTWLTHYEIAHKAMSANISDALSMGAKPLYALLSVAMPRSITKAQMSELYRGFSDCATRYGVDIIGGDTISNTKLDITITIIAKTKKPLQRVGLRKNHLLAYTGVLGESKKGLRTLQNLGTLHKNSRFKHIKLRDKFIYEAVKYMSCGMDISDGLYSDLAKISKANRSGFCFFSKIPKHIGCSGEEYELLFGFDARDKKALQRLAKKHRVKLNIFAKSIRSAYRSKCKSHHF